MYNSVLIIGRTTDKPTLRQLENGTMVANFTLAVNRPYKNLEGEVDVDFINCTAWNATAQSIVEYLKKGSLICVKGIIITREETFTCVKETEGGETYKKKIKYLDVQVEKVIYLKL